MEKDEMTAQEPSGGYTVANVFVAHLRKERK